MKNNHSSTSDSLEYTKSCTKRIHAPFFSMRMDVNRDWEIYQNLNQWLKISKISYAKRSVNNQKVQKFVPAFWKRTWVWKMLQNLLPNICKTKHAKLSANHSINSEDIFKSTKNVLEKRSTKEDSSNTNTSKVLSKIWNRKNLHSSNTTFPWLKVLYKFMVQSVELNS